MKIRVALGERDTEKYQTNKSCDLHGTKVCIWLYEETRSLVDSYHCGRWQGRAVKSFMSRLCSSCAWVKETRSKIRLQEVSSALCNPHPLLGRFNSTWWQMSKCSHPRKRLEAFSWCQNSFIVRRKEPCIHGLLTLRDNLRWRRQQKIRWESTLTETDCLIQSLSAEFVAELQRYISGWSAVPEVFVAVESFLCVRAAQWERGIRY